MKQILSAVLFISIIFFSCQKQIGGKRNSPPVADAGPDQTIIPPTNTVALDASASTDPNDNISSYLWTKVSGPSSFTIANANAVQTQVTNLVEGVYQFELKVTDAGGLFDKDTTQITVMMKLPSPCTNCKIVFVSDRDGNNEIYSCNADGSNVTRLTNDAAVDWDPVWSPDGTRIAFVRGSDIYSDVYGLGDIYIMNADGSNVVQRTFTQDAYNPAWSPDGTRIAFTNTSYNSVFLMNLASGAVSPLPNSDGGDVVNPSPAWSPDGAKIAFDSDRYWTVGARIFTISPDGSGLTFLTGTAGYNFWKPAWSPDGSRISVTIVAPGLGVLIGVMNPDGTGLAIIRTIGPVSEGLPTKTSWSPDGQRIAYTSGDNIEWVAANGSGASGIIITDGWDADWKH